MKVKARKRIPIEVITTVDFPVGKRIKIESDKISFVIKEDGDQIVLELDKSFYVEEIDDKQWIIHSKVIKKPSKNKKFISDIRSYINWSKISYLLANNPSTIRKGHTPKKYTKVVDELLQGVNDWVLKQKSIQ